MIMQKIALRYGLWMFAGFTVFFLLMHLFGLSQNYNLRIFNGVIHLSLIYLAIRDYRHTHEDSVNNYVSGVAMGMYASVIGVIGFTIFMLLYLIGDANFMQALRETNPLGEYLTPITASLFILMEGIAISLIGSYIITRVIDMRLSHAWLGECLNEWMIDWVID